MFLLFLFCNYYEYHSNLLQFVHLFKLLDFIFIQIPIYLLVQLYLVNYLAIYLGQHQIYYYKEVVEISFQKYLDIFDILHKIVHKLQDHLITLFFLHSFTCDQLPFQTQLNIPHCFHYQLILLIQKLALLFPSRLLIITTDNSLLVLVLFYFVVLVLLFRLHLLLFQVHIIAQYFVQRSHEIPFFTRQNVNIYFEVWIIKLSIVQQQLGCKIILFNIEYQILHISYPPTFCQIVHNLPMNIAIQLFDFAGFHNLH